MVNKAMSVLEKISKDNKLVIELENNESIIFMKKLFKSQLDRSKLALLWDKNKMQKESIQLKNELIREKGGYYYALVLFLDCSIKALDSLISNVECNNLDICKMIKDKMSQELISYFKLLKINLKEEISNCPVHKVAELVEILQNLNGDNNEAEFNLEIANCLQETYDCSEVEVVDRLEKANKFYNNKLQQLNPEQNPSSGNEKHSSESLLKKFLEAIKKIIKNFLEKIKSKKVKLKRKSR